ncbi:MAG TPA: IPT/TIG domain-containing protein [Terriglobales bacterium]|nr:IPT/TIG domain-containing protein [Terriglobales bacterium]
MRRICVLVLTICAIGCGYNSKGSGMMASAAPTITQLMPNSAMAGSPAFTLTVNGSNFVNGGVVYWNAATRTTMFVTAGQVTAAISASDIAAAGTVQVYVKNPGGTGIYMNQGGQNSNIMNFTVTP